MRTSKLGYLIVSALLALVTTATLAGEVCWFPGGPISLDRSGCTDITVRAIGNRAGCDSLNEGVLELTNSSTSTYYRVRVEDFSVSANGSCDNLSCVSPPKTATIDLAPGTILTPEVCGVLAIDQPTQTECGGFVRECFGGSNDGAACEKDSQCASDNCKDPDCASLGVLADGTGCNDCTDPLCECRSHRCDSCSCNGGFSELCTNVDKVIVIVTHESTDGVTFTPLGTDAFGNPVELTRCRVGIPSGKALPQSAFCPTASCCDAGETCPILPSTCPAAS